ncbi:hypothetical protein [Allochromatium palmeri]|uniref:ATP-binding protein n=1 Tax=Allochromatium palmeri TaxID=231048 RepID=UPI0016434C59|nr:hypothetical protein [Allochromatium palmeri]
MCDWFLHLAWQMQTHAHIPLLQPGRLLWVRSADDGYRSQFVAPYVAAEALLLCLHWLADTLTALDDAAPGAATEAAATASSDRLRRLRERLARDSGQGINTPRILRAAVELRVPFTRLDSKAYMIGQGPHSRWMRSTYTDRTSAISSGFARHKQLTARILSLHGLPAPQHFAAGSADEAVRRARQLGFPVVIKPDDLDGGKGVHAGLRNEALVRQCHAEARRHSRNILVEKHVEGRDYRLTVFEGRLIKATERIPGGVTGNGVESVRRLIDSANQLPDIQQRTKDRGKPLLQLDTEAIDLLAEAGLTPDSIPPEGDFIRLRRRANVSTGGRTRMVGGEVHPDNERLAIRAAAAMRLDIAGIDLIIPDIGRSWLESEAIICEVNAQPQIGEIDQPGLYKEIIPTLLGGNGRIPVALVLKVRRKGTGAVLERLRTPFAAGADKTVLAGHGLLRLDRHELSRPAEFGYPQATQAALAQPEAERALLVASPADILSHGLPTPYIDLLIIHPETAIDTRLEERLGRLARLLQPHIEGAIVCREGDPLATALIARWPNASPPRMIAYAREAQPMRLVSHNGEPAPSSANTALLARLAEALATPSKAA